MTPSALRALVPQSHHKVLVVGAGQGLIVAWLRRIGHDVVGVDSCPEMVQFAMARRQIRVLLARAEKLPFEDNEFSTVILSTGVLSAHDPSQMHACGREARRVLKSHGLLIAGFPSPNRSAAVVGIKLGYIWRAMQYGPRLQQLAIASGSRHECVELVSKWTACSLSQAKQIVDQYWHHIRSISLMVTQLCAALRVTKYEFCGDALSCSFMAPRDVGPCVSAWRGFAVREIVRADATAVLAVASRHVA